MNNLWVVNVSIFRNVADSMIGVNRGTAINECFWSLGKVSMSRIGADGIVSIDDCSRSMNHCLGNIG